MSTTLSNPNTCVTYGTYIWNKGSQNLPIMPKKYFIFINVFRNKTVGPQPADYFREIPF